MNTLEYWNQFYKKNQNLEASSFFYEVDERIDEEDLIVLDIGCGSGRDSFAFARRGFQVYGIDGSQKAVENNNYLARRAPYRFAPIFKQVDVSNKDQLKETLELIQQYRDVSKMGLLIYARFFLHAIPEETEKLLLKSALQYLNHPFNFMAEFRTAEDEQDYKVYNNHYRRFIDTNQFLERTRLYGYELKAFYKGKGLSIYKDEDPYLARVWLQSI